MNTLQMTLFDLAPTVTAESSEDASIRARFEDFDRQNPHVFDALKRICLEHKEQGMVRWSIKAVWEWLRWMPSIRTSGKTIKLCNDYHALYARKLMSEVTELQGFFEVRSLREKNCDE